MGYGPFDSLADYTDWVASVEHTTDPMSHAVIDLASGKAVGVASYLRIDPPNGAIEVGHINFSPLLQQTIASTEAMYLMMSTAFTLGYRRCEWRCDALNKRSRNAAQRLGFSFEGIFRQATVYKRRNRDTAWYSVIDHEWPALQAALSQWLDPSNFDAKGEQRTRLSDLTRSVLTASG